MRDDFIGHFEPEKGIMYKSSTLLIPGNGPEFPIRSLFDYDAQYKTTRLAFKSDIEFTETDLRLLHQRNRKLSMVLNNYFFGTKQSHILSQFIGLQVLKVGEDLRVCFL